MRGEAQRGIAPEPGLRREACTLICSHSMKSADPPIESARIRWLRSLTMRGHAQTQVRPMPTAVKWVLYAISALMVTLSLRMVWVAFSSQEIGWGLLVSGVLFLTAVGLLRRLTWARNLVSLISVVLLFGLESQLFFAVGEFYPEVVDWEFLHPLPPLWALWLMAVLFAVVLLIPVAIIGWRKDWFRPSRW
jgi:hypothetical protein